MATKLKEIAINKRPRQLKQWLTTKAQEIWPRLLDRPIPVAKGYITLSVVVLLLFFGGIGALHYQAGRLAEATRQAQDVGEAYENLSSFYLTFGGLRSARSKFQQLAAENPDNPWPLILLAWYDYFASFYYNLPENFKAADEALLLNVGDSSAFSELANFYFQRGQYKKMGEAAEIAFNAAPDSAEANFWAGQALKYEGDLPGAQQKFETCTKIKSKADEFQRMCYAELITATRILTITLAKDHLVVQTWAELDELSTEAKQSMTQGEPTALAQQLAWGQTRISPGLSYRSRSISDFYDSVTLENIIVSNQGEEITFEEFWENVYYRDPRQPHLAVEALPLMAYTLPTTITIITEGARVISTSQPYQEMWGKQFIWQLNSLNNRTNPIEIDIRPDTFNQWKLLWVTHYLDDLFAPIIVRALSAIFSLIIFIQIRQYATRPQESDINDNGFLYRLFHPNSLFSWLFDFALIAVAATGVVAPLWYIFWEGLIWNPLSVLGSFFSLPLLLARLITIDWYINQSQARNLIHFGAIIFIFFLIPPLLINEFMPIYLLLAAFAYYLLLIQPSLLSEVPDWRSIKQLFSQERALFVRKIISLDQLIQLENAVDAHHLALAKGNIKADEYQKTLQILNDVIKEKKEMLNDLRQKLNLPDRVSPKNLLFRLGPTPTPFRNGMVAVAFGLIPYLIFLISASWSEDILGSVSVGGLFTALFNTVAVPWGPIYLFFWGFFFHLIWGNYGVTKGLAFALILAGLNFIFQWLWLWDQIDGVQIWGDTVRLIVTFVFTGLMIDWMTTQFSWRQIRLSYDSPAVTTIVSVIATALTTIVTGIATGTLNQLLNIAAQGTAAAFGITPPGGP